MATYRPISLCKNLNCCVYIGNISSLDNQTLLEYCSSFGNVVKFHFRRENFFDFQIIEFSAQDQTDRFLRQVHDLHGVSLDVRSYVDFMNRIDSIDVEQKFFVGPIFDSKQSASIVDFYQKIDPNLTYFTTNQQDETYLLFEMTNRHFASKVIDRDLKLNTNNQRPLTIYRVVNPKKFAFKIFTVDKENCQIYIRGVNSRVNESNLLDYFGKRATVKACHILSNDSGYAVIELGDAQSLTQILSLPVIFINNSAISLSKVPTSIASLLSAEIVQAQMSSAERVRTTDSAHGFNENASNALQNQVNSSSSGWRSPPRTIKMPNDSIEFPPVNANSTMKATSNTNNILHFYEKVQNELEQIREEYRLKFKKNRELLDRDFDRLVHEERQVFERLGQYLKDDRRRSQKRNDHKRKHSPDTFNF